MLSRFKITALQIRHALLSFDDQLSIDDLKAISKQLPSQEEVRLPNCLLLYSNLGKDRSYKGFRRCK